MGREALGLGYVIQFFLNWLGGGIIGQFTKPLLEAYQARLKAQNDHERLEADKTIARLEAARDIALAEASDRWSATRVGRWLIVVPWGIHWALIYAVSIINPNLGTGFVILAVPPAINDMALILVPAIVIGDAATFAVRKLKK